MQVPSVLFSNSPVRCQAKSGIVFALMVLALGSFIQTNLGAEDKRPNVLFIAVDDLKPMLGCYGETAIHSPNIDRLSKSGTVFLNAHCQQAVCGPSRASVMTGLRPDSTKVYDLKTKIRSLLPDVVTLPQYFKNNGYKAVGTGKIFDPRSVDGHGKDDIASWSRPFLKFKKNPGGALNMRNPEWVARANAIIERQGESGNHWDSVLKEMGGLPITEGEDVPDEDYEDGAIARTALNVLPKLVAAKKPFFLAVGFKKPHLPFAAPKKYWDLYQREDVELADFTTMPEGAPEIHFQDSWELRNGQYGGVPDGPFPEAFQRKLIHGYKACISYMDAQVGKLLDGLQEHGVAENTIVVLWGDHGFHLGDHGMWCKHTNYEQATRSPLIISRSITDNKVQKTNAPVELVDIYPTLCEMANLPIPKVLEGVSLVPILEDPSSSVKPVSVSQFPRETDGEIKMGYSLRNESYRYIVWVDEISREIFAEELYHYEGDPEETKNIIEEAAHAAVLKKLRREAKPYIASPKN